MKIPEKKYIFDLDGTLYSFASTGYVTFGKSVFYMDLRKRILAYIADSLKVSNKEAEEIFAKINEEFNGELSIGLEKTYGIDRYAYYEATWSCEPKDYIEANLTLATALAPFRGQALLLTAAPECGH